MSTTINKNIKLEARLEIPENFIGLIYYQDKYLFTLHSGLYKFQGDTFGQVINKNRYKNRKVSKPTYDFNIHYVSTTRHNCELQFNYMSTFKKKVFYTFNVIYEISEPKLFANEILSTWYKTNNDRTLHIVKGLFKDFCSYVMEKRFDDEKSFSDQLNVVAKKYFKKFGISIVDVNLKNQEDGESPKTLLDKQGEKTESKESNSSTSIFIDGVICPKCQSIMPKGSAYCLRCGEKLDKNVVMVSKSKK